MRNFLAVEEEIFHRFQIQIKVEVFQSVRQIHSMFLVLGFAFGSRCLDEVEGKYKNFLKKVYIVEVLVGTATACWGNLGLRSAHRCFGRWRNCFLMETPALLLINLS